ncbi:MAG TPA: relaxase/mobilization nuclease domain-containing protein [Gemmatimonadaceae bacterium]
MIAVSSSSRNFGSLGKYLVVGRDHVESGRVAWTSSRNLPTDDPELAAKIMRATAAQNVRVEKPVYHVVLSFDPGDIVDRATMERVADKLLRELKLQGHQAIIVAHNDRSHPHLHMLINRVHPETGVAWDRWKDYNAIQRVLRHEEKALKVRVVDPSVEVGPTAVSREGAVGGERAQGVPRRLDRVSTVARDLETLDGQGANESARAKAQRDLSAAQANEERTEHLLERESRASSKFDSALREAYIDPQSAKDAFFARANATDEKTAAAEMRSSPDAFGKLNTEAFERRGQPRAEAAASARGAAREAAGHGVELIGARREATRSMRGPADGEHRIDVRIELDRAAARGAVRRPIDAARARLRELGHARIGVGRGELEFRIGQALRKLSPPEVERLRQMLSPEHWSLVAKLKHLVRDAVLGRDIDA